MAGIWIDSKSADEKTSSCLIELIMGMMAMFRILDGSCDIKIAPYSAA
jgi:hypothetical protein